MTEGSRRAESGAVPSQELHRARGGDIDSEKLGDCAAAMPVAAGPLPLRLWDNDQHLPRLACSL